MAKREGVLGGVLANSPSPRPKAGVQLGQFRNGAAVPGCEPFLVPAAYKQPIDHGSCSMTSEERAGGRRCMAKRALRRLPASRVS